jgi:hypothetical protein
MTDDEHDEEGLEEAIEDLEAPAHTQADVVGGKCAKPSVGCVNPTCQDTAVVCDTSFFPVVYDR